MKEPIDKYFCTPFIEWIEKISEIIFFLANPTLDGESSKKSAINFLSSLQEKN